MKASDSDELSPSLQVEDVILLQEDPKQCSLDPCLNETQNAAPSSVGNLSRRLTDKMSHVWQNKALSSEFITLRRSYTPVLLALVYAALSTFSWSIIYVMSSRPIFAPSYNITQTIDYINHTTVFHDDYVKDEQIFRYARIADALANVLTVPITTALCANAVVVFMQQKRRHFSLRQMTVLADKGWFSPKTWLRVLTPGGLKQYGSSLFWLAVGIHMLGKSS